MDNQQKLTITQFKFMTLRFFLSMQNKGAYSAEQFMEGPFHNIEKNFSQNQQFSPIIMLTKNCERALTELANDGIIEHAGPSGFFFDTARFGIAADYYRNISVQLNGMVDLKWVLKNTEQEIDTSHLSFKEIADKFEKKEISPKAYFKNGERARFFMEPNYICDWLTTLQ